MSESGKNPLAESVQWVKGIGPQRAELLVRLGVRTVEDLLYLLPRDYRDLRQISSVADLTGDGEQVVEVTLDRAEVRYSRTGKEWVEAHFADRSGWLKVQWFHRPDIVDMLSGEQRYRLTGKCRFRDGRRMMSNPRIEPMGDSEEPTTPGIEPVYPLTEGLRPERLREAIAWCLERFSDEFEDVLPEKALKKHRFLSISESIRAIHAPNTIEEAHRGRQQLAYEEFLVLQVALALKRKSRQRRPCPNVPVSPQVDARIRRLLPFQLTPDQDRAVADIVGDLAGTAPMNRLLQGDVGSGKTAVAIYALLASVAAGYQVALMAPTEILARQHFRTLDGYLSESRVRRRLLTGSLPAGERGAILEKLHEGEVDLVVGTHALLSKDVTFSKLGLVVIDEQHKFGVRQRAAFDELEPQPHRLVMTATPIPRSLAMTWFGDLDLSIIRSRPPGRGETETYLVPADARDRAYGHLEKQLRMGQQAMVVSPRIESEEEETRDLASLESELAARFADIPLGVVHGKMADKDRDGILRRFRKGDLRLLLSTVIIEVGLDIPNANVIVIEHAERFGLSQLHQIRGRVGRGQQKGICLLIDASEDEETTARLRDFADTNDGFRIAELDAQRRGIGDPVGARQHGFLGCRVGDFLRDRAILERARGDARKLIDHDPSLSDPAWAILRRTVLQRYGKTLSLALVG
ncbi:ATP-dependent DNA helicase RecG [Planctomycetes bacterium Pan216]|uniref:Probable DNA 3'-5' helicase RecG n=1 Tax=Kolteria novifilia TaxID=2527975 RepID=A0A518B9P8_9BACT|nr:ATP-dependent DNA helicase RecG [Planctomycetes bacterium Pan216]